MGTETIRERLHGYIDFADDKKINAIYTMVEDEIVDELDLWNDKDFLVEMKSRLDAFENGTEKGIAWEDVKLKAENRLKVNR